MTDKPFGEALTALLIEQDVSQRELARRTRDRGWGSQFSVRALVNGDLTPTVGAMEAIAQALHVRPEHFAEYRLATVRMQLDPKVVGLKRALLNLEEHWHG